MELNKTKIRKALMDIINDDDKCRLLSQFLELIESDKLQSVLDSVDTIQQAIENAEIKHTEINTILEQLQTEQSDFDGKFEQIDEFYNKIFEEKINSNGEVIHISLDKFIDNAKKRLQELYDNNNSILTSLYDPMVAEGLSKAYADEKQNMQKNIRFWNWIFGVSIVVFLMAFGAYFYLTFQHNFTYSDFFRSLPFWFFSGFFVYYSTKQIAEYKKIASEYAHKETLNRTYIGYKNQVNNADNQELNEQLLRIMLESAQFNPSNSLIGRGEIPNLSMLDKIIDMLPIDKLRSLYESVGKKIGKFKSSNEM